MVRVATRVEEPAWWTLSLSLAKAGYDSGYDSGWLWRRAAKYMWAPQGVTMHDDVDTETS